VHVGTQLTSIKPYLAMLMGNLASLKPNDLIVDPLAGSGSILDSLNWLMGTKGIGAELSVTSAKSHSNSNGGCPKYRPPSKSDVVQADIFNPPFRKATAALGGNYVNAVLFDPPFGLRENATNQIHEGDDMDNPSQCYISDCTGEELLERVSTFVKAALELAAGVLQSGARVVYLLPVYHIQKEMGLWFDFNNDSNSVATDLHPRRRWRNCCHSIHVSRL